MLSTCDFRLTSVGRVPSAWCSPSCLTRLHSGHQRHSARRHVAVAASWKPVVDPASGKTYYWDTETNETAWSNPEAATVHSESAQPEPSTSGTSPPTSRAAASIASNGSTGPISEHAMLERLLDAAAQDSSGMVFWEEARALRKHGVFDEPFFDFLTQQAEAEADTGGRQSVESVRARLCNPLLRQPAPFEF